MKEQIPLKYACMDRFKQVYESCSDQDIKNYLKELQDLIFYQMTIIGDQRLEIVAVKHQKAWSHYDKPLENYDPKTRKYADRPVKIDTNDSC